MSAVILTASACTSNQKLDYPLPPTDNSVTDNYFGITVADPYRPLENDTSAETLAWVEAENKLTQSYLSAIPFRQQIKNRLSELNNYKKTGLPSIWKDGKYYFFENDGLRNQSILYRSDKLDGEAEVFLDPNTFSEDGTVALNAVSNSNDGKYTVYIVSRSGSDWNEIFVMETESKKLLEDHINWAKFTNATWAGDGFYYSAYPQPEKGKEYSNANEGHRIYYHKVGTDQSEDKLIYENPSAPLHFYTSYVPKDENYLFVYGSGEGNGNSIRFKNLKSGSDWVIMEPTQDHDMRIVEVSGDKAYIITNWNAPKNRLMVADLKNPAKENWKELIPEGNGVMTAVDFAGNDKILVTFEKDATDHLIVFDTDGTMLSKIELPTLGKVSISSEKGQDEVFYSLTSFVYPAARFSYNLSTRESSPIGSPEINGINMEDYVTEQVFYTSADGTQVPMFLTYKKGLEKNGQNPVYLYGYGGFNVSLTPGFSPNRLLWLENGGIYAQANLRGGSEYGEDWHQAGTKLNKQNVFDDFIAAAEYLIDNEWTSPEYMTIEGGSNGGLLVGAVVNQRPDLSRWQYPVLA